MDYGFLGSQTLFGVECFECGFRLYGKCMDEAIEKWNRRNDRSRIQSDLMQFMNSAEQAIIKPDESDQVGINYHLRVICGLRDAINEYLSPSRAKP
jgi:hypothetical protein